MNALNRGLNPGQVVETWAESSGRGRTGSAYLVASNAVITAFHCIAIGLEPAGVIEARLLASDGQGVWVRARAVWYSIDRDLALLEVNQTYSVEPVTWGIIQGTEPIPCRVAGFPERETRGAIREVDQVEGVILPLAGFKQQELTIKIDDAGIAASTLGRYLADPSTESLWAGLSGAAVFSRTRLVGVVCRDHRPNLYAGTRLRAVPISSVVATDANFREAASRLGLRTVSRPVSSLGSANSGTAFQQLSTALIDQKSLIDEIGTGSFTGRDWVIDELDKYVSRSVGGYFVLSAEAGWGKTILSAHLHTLRGYPTHFSRAPRGSDAAVAMRSLAVQLIQKYDLEDQAPGGFLPQAASDPGWLDNVLRAAAEQNVADGAQSPLIIIIDGVDDFANIALHPPLGLPRALPTGVYVFLTCRAGIAIPWLSVGDMRWDILATDNRGLRDLRRYLSTRTRDRRLAVALERAGMAVDDFIQLIVDRSAGVWVYVHYLIEEVSSGIRHPTDLRTLPTGLWQYYSIQFWELSQRERYYWNLHLIPLLSTLANAAEPLPSGVISDLAGLPHSETPAIEQFLNGWMRRFLMITQSGPTRLYGLYHPSIADFLSGKGPIHEPGRPDALRSQMMQASLISHHRIAQFYLWWWGGLELGLPRLAADLSMGDVHGGYGRRNLHRHLIAAGRGEELDRVLATESRLPPNEKSLNLWYQLNDRHDDIEGYLETLKMANEIAERGVNQLLRSHQKAASIATEIRYRLISASLGSSLRGLAGGSSVRGFELTAANVADFVGVLVESGAWSVPRAMTELRQCDDDDVTPLGYARLSAHVPASIREAIFEDACRRSEDRPHIFAEVVAAFAGQLSLRKLETVFLLVDSINEPADRLRALAPLVLRRPERLHEVFELIHERRQYEDGVVALETAAPAIAAQDLEAAFRVVESIEWPISRFRAAAAVYSRLPNEEARRDGYSLLLDSLSGPLLDTVETSANWIGKRLIRKALDRGTDDTLPYNIASELWRRDSEMAEAVSIVVPHVPSDLLPRAFDAASNIVTDWYRARAMTGFVARLQGTNEQSRVVQQILVDASARHRKRYRLHSWTQISDDLESGRLLMNRVPEGAKMPQNPDDGWCMEALMPLLRALRPGSRDFALVERQYSEAVQRFDPEAWRTRDLIRFARSAPAGLLLRFLDRIRYVGGDDALSKAEGALAGALKPAARDKAHLAVGRELPRRPLRPQEWDSSTDFADIQQLRQRVSWTDRHRACAEIASLSSSIVAIGGVEAAHGCVAALRDVRAWWP